MVAYWNETPYTVNVYIFAQYVFSCNSRRAVAARKYDASENIGYCRANRIDCQMSKIRWCKTCLFGLHSQKFSCAKIYTFTVHSHLKSTNYQLSRISCYMLLWVACYKCYLYNEYHTFAIGNNLHC